METTDELIQRLIANARKIQEGRYRELDELYHFTKTHLFSKDISDLAEAFGMMAVKLEAREYKLAETINELRIASEELRQSKHALEEYARTLEQKVEERTAEIARIAATDELTGLLNRREVLRLLRQALSRRDLRDLSLVFFDIDHFKRFNDTYGHQVGDEVLKTVGQVVRESVREADLGARYGGEEFLVVLPESDSSEAHLVTGRIQQALSERPLLHEGARLSVTASFGIAGLRDNAGYLCALLDIPCLETVAGAEGRSDPRIRELRGRLVDTLLKMSDDALYTAKRTRCTACGFESEKSDLFLTGSCPKCGGEGLEAGRNRVKCFSGGECG